MGVCLCGIETAFIEFKCTRARIDYLVCTAQAENAVCIIASASAS